MDSPITYTAKQHQGKSVILIQFEFNKELNAQIKKLTESRWSHSKRAWYVPDTTAYRQQFGMPPKDADIET
jgi:hypothetical protein